MPILRKCCFCCELETGGMCVAHYGFFQILVSFVAVLFFESPNRTMLEDIIELESPDKTMLEDIIGLSIALLIYGLMLYGTMKRKHNYLLPWIFLNFIGAIAFGFYIILAAVSRIFLSDDISEDFSIDIFIKIISTLAIYGLFVYIFLAIYSLYVRIKNENNQTKPILLV